MPELVAPTAAVRASFLAAVEELLADGPPDPRSLLARWIAEFGSAWHTPDGFARYVAYLHADALQETPRPAWLVRQSTWWLVDGEDYLGRINVRPHLATEFLATLGGHIGYEVRPSRRREGHATAMLRAVLPHAHALGVDPALVTCDTTNTASRRVIEAAGGVWCDELGGKDRFRLPTSG